MHLLRNHINNDPIIDWFEIQNMRNDIYKKDKNNYFRKYILNETISYKQNFFYNIKKVIDKLYPNKIIYENTSDKETVHLLTKSHLLLQ